MLAEQGWRVLLCTARPLEDAFSWFQEGFEFDHSPEPWWGFNESGFLHPLLAPREERSPVVRLRPSIQVVFPRHRVGFYGLGPDWERELRREFPGSWQEILGCSERLSHLSEVLWGQIQAPLRHLASWGRARFNGRIPLRPFLQELGLTSPFTDMAEAVAAVCFQVGPRDSTVAMAAAAFGHVQRGFFAPRDGSKALANYLISRFQAAGGETRIAVASELATRWGTIRRVRMTDGEVVSCRYVVWEPDPHPAGRILHLLVDEVLIPGEMGRHVLLADGEATGAIPFTLLHLALGASTHPQNPLRQERAVAVRILQTPPENVIPLLERAFPGWGRARICPSPPPQEPAAPVMLRRGPLRPRNLLMISDESPLGRGLSAAAWNGSRVASRLLSRA
jgi:hypothetical protein